MKISLNKIRSASEHFDVPNLVPDGLDGLVQKIGAQLGEVEGVEPFGEGLDQAIIVTVVSCEKHPNADRLNVCKIDDGGVAQSLERDSDGLVQVVCGAPNVHAGMKAAWLSPGATVPDTIGKEPFVLGSRELRGVISNGMLASAKELGLSDNHAGILEVDSDAPPGTTFAEAYRTSDEAIIEIENKMFTHRPDCFGAMGVIREIAGIQHLPFKSPEWYMPNPEFPALETDELQVHVDNQLPELVPRFTMIPMSDIVVQSSPVWLQIALSEVGVRPINNIVDYTNFWMLETGQPLHAYDYDKVKALSGGDGAQIVTRYPKPGEKITLLNGKEIEPRSEAIMIATDEQLIGLGGIMGGSETEVDANTKNIILECGNFNMYSVRRTGMTHGIFTDALTRFNKGQSPLQNLAVLAKIVDHIRQENHGKVAGHVIDDNHLAADVLERGTLYPAIAITPQFINERLGLSLEAAEIKALLENVEFKINLEGETLSILAPFWRTDIEIKEDIVEEVGRLYGYDHLPLTLPKRIIEPVTRDMLFDLKAKIRQQLSKAGANEVLSYSFVHGDLLTKVGQDTAQAYKLSNALSPDLQYYRLSLTPSLLEKVHPNIKAGYGSFALFELGRAHIQGQGDAQEPGVPKELNSVSLVLAADPKTAKSDLSGAPYYQAQHYLDDLLAAFKVRRSVSFAPLAEADLHDSSWLQQLTAPFEPQRSAVVKDGQGRIWGVVGEYKATVRRALKLPEYSAGFEIGPFLLTQAQTGSSYVPLPRFPKVSQDITLKVAADLPYQTLFDFVWSELGKVQPKATLPSLGPIDIYQKDDDPDHKQITLRLTIASYERTLTDTEVNKLLDAIAAAAKEVYGAERI